MVVVITAVLWLNWIIRGMKCKATVLSKNLIKTSTYLHLICEKVVCQQLIVDHSYVWTDRTYSIQLMFVTIIRIGKLNINRIFSGKVRVLAVVRLSTNSAIQTSKLESNSLEINLNHFWVAQARNQGSSSQCYGSLTLTLRKLYAWKPKVARLFIVSKHCMVAALMRRGL